MIKKPRNILILLFCIVGWVVYQMGSSVLHQLRDVPESTDLLHWIGQVMFDIFSNHMLYERLFNGLILYSSAVFFYHLISQAVLHFRLELSMRRFSNHELSREWQALFPEENMRITVISTPSFVAMAVGALKPKIVLSTGAIEVLGKNELQAIIWHEVYHCRFYHPLQNLILTLTRKSFMYLPVIEALVKYYSVWMELMADRYAMRQMNSAKPLGNALLVLLHHQNQTVATKGTVYFAEDAVNFRIKQILDPSSSLQITIVTKRQMMLSIPVLIIVLIIPFLSHV
ncbi:M56 family metallopeptidase [Paenibacillus sp. B01]|uniref:M56 family metallopeptidase n=1 Tax=Paenibacillus sp. B01 TaxID=2660554 RepID=UPI0018918E5A|nr:M56 family metallopeptidase [Paenibacillus sp. B01]